MKKIFSMFFAGVTALSLVGCADDLKDINMDPSNVTETLPEGMLTAAINAFQPNDYLVWYYNVQYFNKWSQMSGGSYDAGYTGQNEIGGQGSQYIATLNYRNKIQKYIDETGKVENNGYLAATGILTIYLAIFDTDMYGSIPYTEASHYDDKGILTPKYERVEDLYNLWLEELDSYINMLQSSDLVVVSSSQDAAYDCDWKKWAKLANTLKLKIAVRLYNNDSAKALQIAEEAASNSAGLITSTDDDFLFCKATKCDTGNNDYVYGTGNGLASMSCSNNVLQFMLGAKDPRVRFIYTKNSFNSSVVQSFIDNGKYDKLPTAVKENVILDEDSTFIGWGGMGEPWVRYTALPIVYDAKTSHDRGDISDDDYEEYFNPGTRYQIKYEDITKSYSPFSYYSNEMRKGRIDFTLPTAITVNADGSVDNPIKQDTDDNPLYTMYLTAGEVNLYMAEFACLKGSAIGGKDYKAWYEAGVRASVEEYDKLASKNKIPYYYDESDPGIYAYDAFEKSIALKDGEIEAMLATDNVKLTGDKSADLEKIYLQLLMHFSEQCDDQYVTARRSGYPKVGSSLIPYVTFPDIALSAIPRRFVVSEPLVSDIMRDIVLAAYKEEGFNTLGTNSQGSQYNGGDAPLNTERVWQDKNAPQWGTPNN